LPILKKRKLQQGGRILVLVVDDSELLLRLITFALQRDPAIEVVGTAANGAIALARMEELKPDLLTLDVDMPEMDGLELLRRTRGAYPKMRVIMVSTFTERGSAVTLDALMLGGGRLRHKGFWRRASGGPDEWDRTRRRCILPTRAARSVAGTRSAMNPAKSLPRRSAAL
jgi:chemotaxis response regulator CheB